jgi:hypothetical protein
MERDYEKETKEIMGLYKYRVSSRSGVGRERIGYAIANCDSLTPSRWGGGRGKRDIPCSFLWYAAT